MRKLTSDVMLELHVPSFEEAKRFYGDLGFKVVWERKPKNREGFLVMRRDASVLNFYCGNEHVYEHIYFRRFPKNTKRGYAMEIIIPVDDIKKLYKQVVKKHKDKTTRPLKKRFTRPDFRMVDPFGFYLRFVERYDWVSGRDSKGKLLPGCKG